MTTFLPNILARALDALPGVGTLLKRYLDDQQRQQNEAEDLALMGLDDAALRALIGSLRAQVEDLESRVRDGASLSDVLTRLDDAVLLVERAAARSVAAADDAEVLAASGLTRAQVDDLVLRKGYVAGPASSTDNAIMRWDGALGRLAQDGVVLISDAGAMTGAASLDVTTNYLVGGAQVVAARVTGWGAVSGTISRSAYATYTAAAVSNPPTQAEVQAIADALQTLSRSYGAAATDLTTHGLIGA